MGTVPIISRCALFSAQQSFSWPLCECCLIWVAVTGRPAVDHQLRDDGWFSSAGRTEAAQICLWLWLSLRQICTVDNRDTQRDTDTAGTAWLRPWQFLLCYNLGVITKPFIWWKQKSTGARNSFITSSYQSSHQMKKKLEVLYRIWLDCFFKNSKSLFQVLFCHLLLQFAHFFPHWNWTQKPEKWQHWFLAQTAWLALIPACDLLRT